MEVLRNCLVYLLDMNMIKVISIKLLLSHLLLTINSSVLCTEPCAFDHSCVDTCARILIANIIRNFSLCHILNILLKQIFAEDYKTIRNAMNTAQV